MTYTLSIDTTHHLTVAVVGCGGTGSLVAEALCRLMIGTEARLTLIDHDAVEPHNLLRQNFTMNEVGRYKSEALAERLAREFKRPISYCTKKFEASSYPGEMLDSLGTTLMIGCVDNAEARAEMSRHLRYKRGTWLIDAGNGENWGQVLIGNSSEPTELAKAFIDGKCHRLPEPTLQRPDLLTYVPDTPPDIDCAAALDLTDQDPTINQMMAALVIQAVRRLLGNRCTYMNLYANMDEGSVRATPATPAETVNILGQHPRLLETYQEVLQEGEKSADPTSNEEQDVEEARDYEENEENDEQDQIWEAGA